MSKLGRKHPKEDNHVEQYESEDEEIALSPSTNQFYLKTLEQNDLNRSQELLFRQACISLDRANDAAREIERDGMTTFTAAGGMKKSPLIDIELLNRRLMKDIFNQLSLKYEKADLAEAGVSARKR